MKPKRNVLLEDGKDISETCKSVKRSYISEKKLLQEMIDMLMQHAHVSTYCTDMNVLVLRANERFI